METYTGIGARDIPENKSDELSSLAMCFYQKGLRLRSGRAEGSDYAFQRGAEHSSKLRKERDTFNQEIYLPKPNFNTCFGRIGAIDTWKLPNYEEAEKIMEDIHPAGRYLKGFARQAHTRNVYQVLGLDLNSPSDMLICYALPDPKNPRTVKGGTATAYSLAKLYKIPCYNTYFEEDSVKLWEIIQNLKSKS